ncbi:DMT family transporter [Paracraurococcus ruber]|uniref:Multidrug transporter n=1 Tax=Paracraurococcus ruber TaxID=77675 RepID=A0ABS1CW38_9PROT|nr:DMT family transporter [Paracraurococcus ruber]MBK1658736.1 multidrug transporter [Paracraurococcus ruber]TDG30332.1 DMT family transporter [Paracraurococcus ruber]
MALRHDIRRGALCMLAAHALFTAMGAVVKTLADHIPVIEIMFFRSAFALPVVLLITARSGGATLRTRRFGGHALRACTGIAAQTLGFYALGILPLAEQVALGYTQPLFVTILAIPFLGERVGLHRWSAVGLGFCGVLLIAAGQGLGGAGLSPELLRGTAAGVAQGMFSALTTLLVRQLSATESSATITLWQSLLMGCYALLLLPFFWVTPTWGELGLLVLVGLVGGCAQWLLTEAWASAQVSAVAPYSYSALLWSVGLGWLVFGDLPGLGMVAGSALIVVAGLYILHRELVRKGKR